MARCKLVIADLNHSPITLVTMISSPISHSSNCCCKIMNVKQKKKVITIQSLRGQTVLSQINLPITVLLHEFFTKGGYS